MPRDQEPIPFLVHDAWLVVPTVEGQCIRDALRGALRSSTPHGPMVMVFTDRDLAEDKIAEAKSHGYPGELEPANFPTTGSLALVYYILVDLGYSFVMYDPGVTNNGLKCKLIDEARRYTEATIIG